jgi:membrane protein DedA with SNARE-associated domain
MHWFIAAPVAWLGIITGDCVLYRLGYRFGHNITRVPFIGKHVTVARIKRAEVLFDHYGVLVVGVGRMFAGIRGAMVIAAGTIRYKFIKFIIADGLGAIVSGGVFMFLGIWFGANLDTMKHLLHEFRIGISIAGIILGIALIFYIQWRAKKHKTIGDVVMKEVQVHAEAVRSAAEKNETPG